MCLTPPPIGVYIINQVKHQHLWNQRRPSKGQRQICPGRPGPPCLGCSGLLTSAAKIGWLGILVSFYFCKNRLYSILCLIGGDKRMELELWKINSFPIIFGTTFWQGNLRSRLLKGILPLWRHWAVSIRHCRATPIASNVEYPWPGLVAAPCEL